MALESGYSSYRGSRTGFDRNPQHPEPTEANWTTGAVQCAFFLDNPSESSLSQDMTIDTDHNPGITGANSMAEGNRCEFVQGMKTVFARTPGIARERVPVQGTTNSKVEALPTHPSSDRTRSTSSVQPVQDTCSGVSSKADYTRSGEHYPGYCMTGRC